MWVDEEDVTSRKMVQYRVSVVDRRCGRYLPAHRTERQLEGGKWWFRFGR
jgi:hypothetical protein